MRPSLKRNLAIAATLGAMLAGCNGAADEGDVRNIGEEDGSSSSSSSGSSSGSASGSASGTEDEASGTEDTEG